MDLTELELVYLPDATPVPEQVISDLAAWQSRPVEEREQILRLAHDYAVGEGWENQDTWQDVHFSKAEIDGFSKHILVENDPGLPEWLDKTTEASSQNNSPSENNGLSESGATNQTQTENSL